MSAVPRRPLKRRTGFTLVELLVALAIFSIGALAMAATAGHVMRLTTSAKTRALASAVADNRFERLAGQPCSRRSGGSAVTTGVQESWSVVPLVRADDVSVRVTFLSFNRYRTQTFRSFLPC